MAWRSELTRLVFGQRFPPNIYQTSMLKITGESPPLGLARVVSLREIYSSHDFRTATSMKIELCWLEGVSASASFHLAPDSLKGPEP